MRRYLPPTLIAALILLAGCGGGSDLPVADAGPDQYIDTRSLIILSGRGADTNPALQYRWSITNKPPGSRAILSNAYTRSPTFPADIPGIYLIKLEIVDGVRIVSEDTTRVFLDSRVGTNTQDRTVLDAWKSLQGQIDKAGSGARLHLNPNIVYKLTSSLDLRDYRDITIDGNGATLLRADASEVSTILSYDYDGSTIIHVTAVPPNYRIGDFIVIASGQSINDVTVPARKILRIDGNFIEVDSPFSGPHSSGSVILKSFPLITGMPSHIESGSNPGIILQNIIFDGNGRANTVNFGWPINGTIILHGGGNSEIRFNRFIDISNENIIGHGIKIHHNTFDGLNGSALHTSVNDITRHINTPASFTDNAVFNPNRLEKFLNGHSEGAITFSWGEGLQIERNFFISDSHNYGVLGFFNGTAPNRNDNLFVKENYAYGFEYIIDIYKPLSEVTPLNILVTNNIFINSGGFIVRGPIDDASVRLGCNVGIDNEIIEAPQGMGECI